MPPDDRRHLRTRLIHPPVAQHSLHGDVVPPLHLTTTFAKPADPDVVAAYSYTRDGNPNREDLERCLADIEHGADAAVFASGSAATLAVFQAIAPGGHIVASTDAYHGTLRQLRQLVPRLGLTVTFVDTSLPEAVAESITPATRLIWVETPSNPLLRISDIATLAVLAREAGATLACDNTFATPVLQNPLVLGAGLCVHSATKYLGGHSDLTGGAVITANADELFERVRLYQRAAGAMLPPFECWLLMRSLRSLDLRVRAQAATAQQIAEYLVRHPAVRSVHYPGLAPPAGSGNPHGQMQTGGAMLSFCLASREEAFAVLAAVTLFNRATSLGGVESLIEHRASSEGADTRTPQELLRVSVGLEHPDDLVADLEQALATLA